MSYFQKLRDFFKKPLSAAEFRKCVFFALKKRIIEEAPVQEELREMQSIGESEAFDGEQESKFAGLYLRLEEYLAKEQAGNRVSKEELRGFIAKNCGAARAAGDFALLFLSEQSRRVKLFERFAGEVLQRSENPLGQERFNKILAMFEGEIYLKGAVKDGAVDWKVFDKKMQEAFPSPNERVNATERLLKAVLGAVFSGLKEALESLRAELVFRDAYKQFHTRLKFLDDTSQVLLVVPKDILKEERVEIMSKSTLIDELRRRNQELEYALAQLSEEKRKLDEEKQKLAAALNDLQVVDRAKSDFITVVSHQFRTPLSAIRWNNELLSEEISKLEPEQAEALSAYTKIANEKIVFLVNVLEDIYDVLAIEGKTSKIEKQPAQLWEIVNDVMNKFKDFAVGKKVALKFDRSTASLKEIKIDKQKVKRVCEILIRNAIQYTPENGTVTATIQETDYQGKPALSCSIQDTGIGIAPEDGDKLFDKFFRGKNAVKMVPDGAGLGLYLVRYFVEAHGGTVRVESELDKGSTFSFILPLE